MNSSNHVNDIAVIGMGLCTPLGLTARTTQVEIAAGTVRFFEIDGVGSENDSMQASLLTLLDPEMSRTERMIAMATTALDGCLGNLYQTGTNAIPGFLGLPHVGIGGQVDEEALINALMEVAPPDVQLRFDASNLCANGRSGLFQALGQAWAYLEAHPTAVVLLGAVDSMCDQDSLTSLMQENRILGERNPDGLIPGEAAGFFLLMAADNARKMNLKEYIRLLCYALAKEPRHVFQEQPNLGEGLTHAFRQLRQHPRTRDRRVDYLHSCQTGESIWATEFAYAYLRNVELMPEPLVGDLIAESLGDAGAGSAAVQLGMSSYTLEKLCRTLGNSRRSLTYGCSDDGQIGACIVEKTL